MKVFNMELNYQFSNMIIWLLVMIILLGVFLAIYPTFQKEEMKVILDNGVEALPETVKDIILPQGVDGLHNIYEYSANILMLLSFFIAIFAISTALNSVSREQGFGTIDYLYSNPISRTEIIISKFLAIIINYLVFILLMFGALIGMIMFLEKQSDIMGIFLNLSDIVIGFLVFGFVFISIGFLISSILKTTRANSTIAFLIVLISIILPVLRYFKIVKVSETISNMVSPLTVYNPINIINTGLAIKTTIIYLIFGIVALILSLIIYNNKDLEV
ncbi:MAG: ABC transporter permease subunit [Tissierellia bacterium]|nr:ABC transporter permease subunit [Tissierellia bacterium]